MSPRTTLRPFVVVAGIGAAVFAVHCSSSDSGSSGASCVFNDADPTTIRRLTTEQQSLVTQTSDRVKAALSGAEWRYLFKLRYAFFSRAAVEADPVVVKALTVVAQSTPACTGTTTSGSTVDKCDRFVNVGRCWTGYPVNSATIPCFTWSMMIANSAGCGVTTSPAATYVDAEAWDDAQDGRETDDCSAPCIAGGGCSHGVCKCAAEESPCAGGCARTKSDVVNCGGCGHVCGAGIACVEGVCGGAADAGADGGGVETDAGDDGGADAASDGGN